MTQTSSGAKSRMVLVPDLNHMLWHHTKEELACDKLFGRQPQIKGALAEEAGSRIWAIWTHRFYGDPTSPASGNTLYILRLVVEKEMHASNDTVKGRQQKYDAEQHEKQVDYLRAVTQTAQAEAAEWKLSSVNLWDPSSLVQEWIERSSIQYCKID